MKDDDILLNIYLPNETIILLRYHKQADSDDLVVTPGNTQKWQYTEPTQNSFSFDQADVITSLAKNNSQLLRCYTLVWYV